MIRVVGYVVSGLGAFLLTVALLIQLYGSGAVMRTPLDVDSTTLLEGTAQLGGESLPVAATSITRADSEKSSSDAVFFENSSCLVQVIDDERGCVSPDASSGALLSASVASFATDRSTALGLSDREYLDLGAEPREGLVNKWPFQAEQITYPVWDDTVEGAVDGEFVREEQLNGVTTHVYRVVVEDFPAVITGGVDGTYSVDKEIYVEPTTGSIVHQVEHREQHAVDGTPVLLLDLAFTDDQVATSVDEAKANRDRLNLVTGTVPLLGYVLGIPLLLLGVGTLVLASRRSARDAD